MPTTKPAAQKISATANLPDLSGEYPLAPEQIKHFRSEGFVILRGVLTPEEVEAYRAEIKRATFELNKEKRKLEERDAYGKAFLQTLNLRLHSEGVRKLVTSRRLGKIAADLMGVDGVRVYHEQSLFKEPGKGTNPTPWHQDQYYWPLEELTTLGFWMALVDVEQGMGGMKWAAGTHKLGFLGQHAISDESQKYYEAYIQEHHIRVTEGVPMKQGDVSFHYGWTLHAAGPNCSNKLREAMIGTYFADGMRVMKPSNASQEGDRVKFLGGKQPGELADSPLNTLVYKKC
ncbi:MAG: phytanoyl-CoA dioxygenase family protein [Methylacidiphilales bacterium]|nr:phytanoyl-CoA dioxygenase family protein [Candidatus Methylacidiphilales bacterium]